MRRLSVMSGIDPVHTFFQLCSGTVVRAIAALMLVALSSCGGASSPTVALGNMVPVRLAMHLPGQAVAQADLMDKVLDLAIPDANAINLAGVASVTVTISGNGFATIVDSFPAGAPGTQLVKQYSVPQGAARTFSIQGFNTPVGTPAAVPVLSGTTTVALAPSAAPVLVDVLLTPPLDTQPPVVTAPAPVTIAAVDATGAPRTNAAITAFLAAASATDNVDMNPVVTNDAPLQLPLGPTTVTFTSTDAAGNVSTPVPVVVTVADQTPPVIALLGANPMTVVQGSVFTDPGSNVTDNVDLGLVAGVTGVVDTAVPGRVTLTYNVSDAAGNPATPVTRVVNVTQVTRQMQGVVKESNGTAIQGASVNLAPGTNLTATTDVNGVYTVLAPLATYTITVTKAGFTNATATFALTAAGSTTAPVIFLAVANAGTGGISGTVKDAINNTVLAGAGLEVRLGVNAPAASPIVATAISSATGAYTFSALAAGTYTVTASKTGFANTSITVTVSGGATTTANPVLMSAVLPAGQTRIVLSWGASPTDLDSHLVGPVSGAATGSQQFHVHFRTGRRGSMTASPFAQLNSDVTAGFGPETITVAQTFPGTYRYYAHDYTNRDNTVSTALSGGSNAVVQVFQGANEVARFNVPVTGAGDLWHVFDMDGQTGAITAVNQIALAKDIPAMVTATPATATVAIPGTQQSTASVESVRGLTPIPFTGIFTSSNTAVAPVSATGLVTALGVGAANITATEPVFGYSAISAMTVTLDITPPTILSNTPAAAATGVLVNSPVTVTFSEAMNPATVTPASFTLNVATGAAVTGIVRFNAAGTIANFIPNGNLLPNTTYTASLSTTGMTDIAGNPVATASPFTFSFTTGASVVTLPPVLPVVQGPVTNLGAYDGFDMVWSGIANGANALERWTTTIVNPTTTVTGVASFSDGVAATAPPPLALATRIAANGIIQFTDATTAPANETAAVSSRDGQLGAFAGFVNGADLGLFVKQRIPIHTAATSAGVFNIIQLTRTPGPFLNSTATSHGVLTINTNGTWTLSATGSSVNPQTLQLNPPFAINDNGTFIIDPNGVGIATSAVNVSNVIQTLESADGNYITGFSLNPATRESTITVGVRQHTTTVSVANSTFTNIRAGFSGLAPATAVTGEAGILTVDANGLLNDTHGSRIDNAVICGIPGQANCQFQVGLATTITPGANGTIIGTDSTGATFSDVASQNGNVILSEDKGRAINILFKQ